MSTLARAALALALALCAYTYIGYPAILALLGRRRRAHPLRTPVRWPRISIVLPAHNEAEVIADALERILALDYPADLRQVLVVSDASSDGTDDIVSSFASRGVELLRLPERRGKTAAENAARAHLTGEIIVNTDASVRIHPQAVRHLVAAFGDPSIGVASGRDVSVAHLAGPVNAGEGAYVGYEMWVRGLETRVGGIVGASGCLYAIRADLHMAVVPEALSRDFSAALTARERGLRAVSVPEAVCAVPRATSLRQEYRRKVRTVTRGIGTLLYRRALLDPRRFGAFAWMLFSHKVCRWLVPLALVLVVAACAVLAATSWWARVALVASGGMAALAALGWLWPAEQAVPRFLALPAYVAAGNVAVLQAWLRVLTGRLAPVWEPTRRGPAPAR